MSIIYLASPYSDPNPNVRRRRFQLACEHAAFLMRDHNLHVFSPIAHSHPIAEFGLPSDWGFWQEYDKKFIAMCERMFVLKLHGWEQSKGVDAEISIALHLGIPVEFYNLFQDPKNGQSN